MKHDNSVSNVIYLNTAEKGPSGGGKTIYNHSHLINKLNIKNLTSEILHVKKKKISKWNTSLKKILKIDNSNYFGWTVNDITVSKNFKSRWFNKKIKIKNNFTFENKKDFVIFPEIFAHFAKKLCIEKKVPYEVIKEKEVPVYYEKIVEIDVPVEKIVENIVEVEKPIFPLYFKGLQYVIH